MAIVQLAYDALADYAAVGNRRRPRRFRAVPFGPAETIDGDDHTLTVGRHITVWVDENDRLHAFDIGEFSKFLAGEAPYNRGLKARFERVIPCPVLGRVVAELAEMRASIPDDLPRFEECETEEEVRALIRRGSARKEIELPEWDEFPVWFPNLSWEQTPSGKLIGRLIR
jgi:hypothetical protein